MSVSASARPVPRPGVLAIDAYVPGKSAAPGVATVYKLSSNETPLGPSPAAVAALRAESETLDLYPDGRALRLRTAIAARYGLDPARIVCGAGSDELLSLLALAFVGPGDEGIFCEHGFLIYRIAILTAGGTPVVAPETNLTADVDAILAAVTPRTKIVYLANPNNPTGTYLPFDEVRRLHAGLPPHVLLVIDAAYAEYVRANDYSAGLDLALEAANVVMTRTFSKIHGLAAQRIGWLVGPEGVVDALNRIRGPFNVSGGGIAAGAAAIADEAHVAAAIAHNDEWLGWLTERVRALGLADLATDDVSHGPSQADLVVLCVPVGAIGGVAAEIAPHLKAGAILSDVGSVKGAVVSAVAQHLDPARNPFVPAHPVAGTEYSGPDSGFATLFSNRWCILTPPEGTDPAAVARVEAFWRGLGAIVETMSPEHHDLVLAITSHVPHLIAYNIVGTAADLETVTQSEVIKFSAGGFRDFTRIASSDPTMWRDVFLTNKEAVLEMLGRFNEDLSALARAIRWGDGDALHELFTRTREIRRGIVAMGQETAEPDFGRGRPAAPERE